MTAVKGLLLSLGCACSVLVSGAAEAALSASEAYQRLRLGLEKEVALLSSVQDEGTAAEALNALRKNHAELSALNDEITPAEFWRYIDNTPDRKGPLMALLQKMTQEFQRLEGASFFSCEELRSLMAPLLSPSAAPSTGA